jgi:hypothetical protein
MFNLFKKKPRSPAIRYELDTGTVRKPGPAVGYVRGLHYTGYVEEVKQLRRSGQETHAERLLLELVQATEDEATVEGWGVLLLGTTSSSRSATANEEMHSAKWRSSSVSRVRRMRGA